ncbi:hypothetical protein [Chryseosolibacter indicus]|uniref:Uncharacterized protein n=1 Tax=Chryseosolibacter indicus TaxID=2782351 RepID=A0ABS5VSZ3_9BACT|nr:hypothetical protein [Chryseosolibacter indicus]MBT1704306.1 hypothetical protein [Chryseosolibacter indicus]
MKNLKTIILLTGVLITAAVFNVSAQTRPHKTASAKAYYGQKPKKQKFKKKKSMTVSKHKPSKVTSAHVKRAATRRRSAS